MRLKGPIIKPRPLTPATFAGRVSEFRKPLIFGVLGVLLLAIAWLAYWSVKSGQEEAAQSLLSTALQMTETEADPSAGPEAAAVPGAPKAEELALGLLEQISVAYPSSRAGEHALLQTGHILFDLEKYPEASVAYQRYLERYPAGSSVFLAGLGRAYAMEAQARYKEAASIFQNLVDRHPGHPMTIEALMGLGRCLTLAENKAEAGEIYSRVVKDYAGTSWSRQAEEMLAVLER